MITYKKDQLEKIFVATGLRIGDEVTHRINGSKGFLYLSGFGYICVRMDKGAVIWGDVWIKVPTYRKSAPNSSSSSL